MTMLKFMTLYKIEDITKEQLIEMAEYTGIEYDEEQAKGRIENFLSYTEILQYHADEKHVFFADLGDTYWECGYTNYSAFTREELASYEVTSNELYEIELGMYDTPDELAWEWINE